MSDKSTILKAFNGLFFEFLDDIISIFPENEDILTSRGTFETFRKANPTVILKAWYSHVYLPYSDVIHAGDITFFFKKDYTKDLEDSANQNRIMEFIDKFRGPVQEMSPTNQAHSVAYMQKLSKLSVMYHV